ncbi:GatB/YqeY domain-containing protein [Halocola ammonii]
MSLTDKINNDIKEAMKAKDRERLSALRDIKSKLLMEATKEGSSGEVDDETGIKILSKLHKQRMESAAIYKEQGREELMKEEMDQADVIETYLPEQMSDEELEKEIQKIIEQTGAQSPADMGKVMGVASKQFAGKADGKVVASKVKELLSK